MVKESQYFQNTPPVWPKHALPSRTHGERFGLLYPARFKITYKEDSKEFRDPIKAMDYIKKTILATATETET